MAHGCTDPRQRMLLRDTCGGAVLKAARNLLVTPAHCKRPTKADERGNRADWISAMCPPSAFWQGVPIEYRSTRNCTSNRRSVHRLPPDSVPPLRPPKLRGRHNSGIEREEHERTVRNLDSWKPPLIESLLAREERSHTAGAESSSMKGLRKKEPDTCISYLVILRTIFRNICKRSDKSIAGERGDMGESSARSVGEFPGGMIIITCAAARCRPCFYLRFQRGAELNRWQPRRSGCDRSLAS
jgi:hypothetical protein